MIGDAEADVGGAMAAGASLMGVLVQTGKYRPGQQHRRWSRKI
jgi:phosphoglycolate phosphatase-like HAD superfamily hydrolase